MLAAILENGFGKNHVMAFISDTNYLKGHHLNLFIISFSFRITNNGHVIMGHLLIVYDNDLGFSLDKGFKLIR